MSEALQKAIEAINAVATEGQELIAAKCRALVRGYDAAWQHQRYTAIAVERVEQTPLTNPETGRISRTYSVAGKLDVIAELNNQIWIIDHKTTSQDISDPNAPYWRQLVVEGQVNHYMLMRWLQGDKVFGAVWDVVRKPSISPKAISKAECAKAVADRRYCGVPLSMDSLNALQIESRETLEMYEARLTEDCTFTRPEWYFQRRTVARLDSELLEYANELWQHGQDMLAEQQRLRTTRRLPVRNSGACMLYGSPCKFLGVCSGHDTAESDNWKKKEHVHNELDGIDGDGRDVLTNSRIRCFQTCKRKHYYQYELGIERIDAEEREALAFGTLYHAGLEAWWQCFLKGDNHDDCNESPAIGVGNGSAGSQTELAFGSSHAS